MTRRTAFLSLAAVGLRAAGLPEKTVVLTFDDGVVSHAITVGPLLKKFGFTGTFFVCEFPPDFADKSKYMTWEQIRGLHDMGFEVGSHTHTHSHVTKLSAEGLHAELAWVEDKFHQVGIPKPVSFAYPGYDTHPTALAVLKQRGYLFARTGGKAPFVRPYEIAEDNPLLMPSFTSGEEGRPVFDAFAQAQQGQVIVLTVHGVPDNAHPWVTTPLPLFQSYLEYLKVNRFTALAMRDLRQYLPRG